MKLEKKKFLTIVLTILLLANLALIQQSAKGQAPGKIPDATRETILNGENPHRGKDAAASPGIRLKSNDPALGPLRETFSQLFRDISEVHAAIPGDDQRLDARTRPPGVDQTERNLRRSFSNGSSSQDEGRRSPTLR